MKCATSHGMDKKRLATRSFPWALANDRFLDLPYLSAIDLRGGTIYIIKFALNRLIAIKGNINGKNKKCPLGSGRLFTYPCP